MYILLLLITNWTICNVFKPRLIANCALFFMVFLDSFFLNTDSDMDDVFCLSTNFIGVEGSSSNILLHLDLKRLSNSNCIKLPQQIKMSQ